MASVAGTSSSGPGTLVHTASTQSGWIVANSDLQTADSATNLLKPQLVTRAAVTWLRVPDGATRFLLRGRNLATMSATGTPAAVVKLFGVSSHVGGPDTTLASTATTSPWATSPTAKFGGTFMCLDNADAGATGITLTFATTGNLEDATYEYTDLPDLTGYDCKGCSWVGVLVATACAVTGSATVEAMVKFIN